MLTSRAHRYMRGKHNRKTSAFVKAALAYCHITAPSISDSYTRFSLLIACAEAALYNCCLPQTDTFLKAAISLLPDLPVRSSFLCDFYNICHNMKYVFLLFLPFLLFPSGSMTRRKSNNYYNSNSNSNIYNYNYREFTSILEEYLSQFINVSIPLFLNFITHHSYHVIICSCFHFIFFLIL